VKHPELKFIRTTAVRLALNAIAFYSMILLFVFIALYWASNRHINNSIESELRSEIHQLIKIYEQSGQQELIEQINKIQDDKNRIYYLQSSSQKKLAGDLLQWPDNEIELNLQTQGYWIDEEIIPLNIRDDDAYWPVIATELSNGSRLLIARNIHQEKLLHELSEFLIEAMGIAIAFALFISIVITRQILKRIYTIKTTAQDIIHGDLSKRIALSNRNDEFDGLSHQLNVMLDKIQFLIRNIREVTDNVAHDLRSPLTRMRNKLEVTLLEKRSTDEYEKVLRENIEDIKHLIKTFNALLSISQTEAGGNRSIWSNVDLKQLTVDLIDLYTPLAEKKEQTLEFQNGVDAIIYGSRDLLAQSFGNLLENAIKYTPAGGTIRFYIKSSADTVDVLIEDTGPGIPDNEKDHVLEKFVRLDTSRHTHGNGLGLSLVAAVAKLHGAELSLTNTRPGLRVSQRFNKI